MPNPLIRFAQFVRANDGPAAVLRLVMRKVRERGPLYTLRAALSNLSPVPRFPERRYRHYIARHEAAHHARLLAHAGEPVADARAPVPTVLLIVCGAERGETIGGRDRERRGGSLPLSEPGRQNRPDRPKRPDRLDPNRVEEGRTARPDATIHHPPLTIHHPPSPIPSLPPNWRTLPLASHPSAEALNAAIRDGSEHYVAILWPGDRLAPDAAAIVNAALVQGQGFGVSPLAEPSRTQRPDRPDRRKRPDRLESGQDDAQRADTAPFNIQHSAFSIQHSTFSSPSLLYSDEDQLDARGRRCRPHFKPGWSPDTLLDWPYMGDLCLFERQSAREASGFCADFTTPDALLYDLVLRLTERDPRVRHIPAVLYHRQAGQRRGGDAAPYPADAPHRTPAEKPTSQVGRAVPASRAPADLISTELTEARRRAAARRGIPVVFEDTPTAAILKLAGSHSVEAAPSPLLGRFERDGGVASTRNITDPAIFRIAAPAAAAWAAARPDLGFAPLLSLPRLRPLPPAPAEAGAEGRDATGRAGPGDRIDPIDRSDLIDLSRGGASHGAQAEAGAEGRRTPGQVGPGDRIDLIDRSDLIDSSQGGAKHGAPVGPHHSLPLISLLIPTRNHVADLSTCIASILAKTTYTRLEILVIDNGSDEPEALRYLAGLEQGLRTAAGAAVAVRVLRLEIPFNFSVLNNRAAAEAAGSYLLFLNNDTEVVTPDWIERMLGHAAKPWAGAVGATLLYPDGTLQHAGVSKVGLGPTHVFGHLPANYPHPRCQRDGNWSAVTAACLMVSADKFRAVGGFDESLAVAFNDVDLCFRLLDRGWYAILASQARLIHHEFKTRGHDRSTAAKHARMLDELNRLYARWPQFRADPFYNPALSVSYPDFLPRS